MALRPIIFEDHAAAALRPLCWSVPAYELRCGLFNLRERAAALCGREPEVLPRGFLAPLAEACGQTLPSSPGPSRVLFLSARLGPDRSLLSALLAAAEAGAGWGWADVNGVLAACLDGAAAEGFLTSWRAWDDEAAASGCWRDAAVTAPVFAPAVPAATPALPAATTLPQVVNRLWDLVPALAGAIAADADHARLAGLPARRPWGAVPEGGSPAPWSFGTAVKPGDLPGSHLIAPAEILVGDDVQIAPGVVLDASRGPIVIDRGVRVQPHTYLEGPLYLGPGAVVKAGARLAECSFGAVCKVAGEIGESTFLDLVNKQHDGFIGHAYLGSWVNLGAMTTCSDLKNNYGRIRVDVGAGEEDTGQRFLGLMMAEHGKTAIGTLFNTGTAVGFASNVFAAGFPPKAIPNFTWGDGRGTVRQDADRAAATAAVAMARRSCRFTPEHRSIFARLGGGAG